MRPFLFALAALVLSLSLTENVEAFGRARVWPREALRVEQNQSAGDRLAECRRPELGDAIVLWNRQGQFLPQCAPDTLYSWRSLPWTQALQQRHSSSADHQRSWPRAGDPAFVGRYFWRTPLGTFGYGDSVLRVKLRAAIAFRAIEKNQRDCSLYSTPEKEHTVFVPLHNPRGGAVYLSEFFTCSESVIQSWSIDAPQAYEEALRELAWIMRKPVAQWDAYIPNGNMRVAPLSAAWFSLNPSNASLGARADSRLSLFPFVGDHDRVLWSYDAFVQKLRTALARMGDIGVRQPVASQWEEQPAWKDHFLSVNISYFYQRSIAAGDLRYLREELPPEYRDHDYDETARVTDR